MAENNPVQIVLNDRDYIKAPEPGSGGPPTDFFAGRDNQFVEHKTKLQAQAKECSAALAASGIDGMGYVRVQLQEDALAKSHRPVRALLTPDQYVCVGAGSLGELFYLATADKLKELVGRISDAEDVTTWVEDKDGKLRARPTARRSDVGAISEITVPSPADKRNFSATAAIGWLTDEKTGGAYHIELFENPRVANRVPERSRGRLAETFEDLVRQLGPGVQAWRLPKAGGLSMVGLRVSDQSAAPRIAAPSAARSLPTKVSEDPSRHQAVLDAVARHPAVRRISLPLRLEISEAKLGPVSGAVPLTSKDPMQRYPRVGVVDTGLGPALNEWVIGRHDFLDVDDVDPEHGSFIGGLLVGAASLNPSIQNLEGDGCELVDIALFPKSDFLGTYPRGFDDFLEELEQGVSEAVQQHGVRVINLSINATSPVDGDLYSYYAARLDEIAEKYGVIFVNSVGNLAYKDRREPWPKKTLDVLKYFASRVDPDTIHKPCESHMSVAVGAVNPSVSGNHIGGVPTTYSRRGPGLKVGCKPDVAHIGGNEGIGDPADHGLTSIGPSGEPSSSCGTSFAAPLVAKTLASLDHRIEAELPIHTLRALLVHHCETPAALADRRLSHLARQFTGFGVPCASEEMLTTGDHSITMVFSSRLPNDIARPKVLRFDFQWPQSLVDPATGACFGQATAALVYHPPVDAAFGAEFVRVNLDAKLMQRQTANRQDGSPSYRDQFQQCFLPKTSNQPVPEKELIKQGLKWWPTKRYLTKFPAAGIGSSSEWRLEVSSLRRAEATFPSEGVPFSVVLTISDPEGKRPIFQELRRNLQAQSVQLEDIRTHQRLRA